MPVAVGLTLRRWGHTVTLPKEIGATNLRDWAHLLNAKQRNAILVTRDFDFLEWHDAWRAWSGAWNVRVAHPGILHTRATWTDQEAADRIHDFAGRRLPVETRL